MAKRALVLGGGGAVGIAWESGLIAGLAEGGVDVGQADFILGTSAGSFVGAGLAMGRPAAGLAAPFLAAKTQASSAASPPQASARVVTLIERMNALKAEGKSEQEARAAIAQWAATRTDVPSEKAFLASFGKGWATMDEGFWPERNFACAAVAVEDGRFVLWTRESGVGLKRAVASSCSVPGIHPPVTIDGARYVDGGVRSGTNADQAKGHDVVLVVAVVGRGAGAGPNAMRAAAVEREVAELKASGATVALITPDETSQATFGGQMMDPLRRPAAAAAGVAQGRLEAARLRGVWAPT